MKRQFNTIKIKKSKQVLMLALLGVITLMSLTNKSVRTESKEALAKRIVNSINEQSFDRLTETFPTQVDNFYVIEVTNPIYGENIEEAKAEYLAYYKNSYLPKEKQSFKLLLAKMNGMSIKADELSVESVKIKDSSALKDIGIYTIEIVLNNTSKPTEQYILEIEKVLEIKGMWFFNHGIEIKIKE